MLNRAILLAAATRPPAGGTAFVPSDIAGLALPRLDLNDVEAIADFVVAHCGLTKQARAG